MDNQKKNRMQFKWTLNQMFFGSFLVALIIPYVLAILPASVPPLKEFTLTTNELQIWLTEEDPSLRFSGSTQGSVGLHNSEGNVTITSSVLSAEYLFQRIGARLKAKIENESWSILSSGGYGDSQMFEFTDGHSKRYFYILLKDTHPPTFKFLSIRYPSYLLRSLQ